MGPLTTSATRWHRSLIWSCSSYIRPTYNFITLSNSSQNHRASK